MQCTAKCKEIAAGGKDLYMQPGDKRTRDVRHPENLQRGSGNSMLGVRVCTELKSLQIHMEEVSNN